VASEATVTGTIELNQAVPQRAGAVVVALESSNSGVAEVTATVEIAPGTGQASFSIHAHQVNPDTTVIIKARLGRQTVQASMLVRKPNYTPPPKSLP
jgi:hypothetical protein